MGIPFPSRVRTSLCVSGCVWPAVGVYVSMLPYVFRHKYRSGRLRATIVGLIIRVQMIFRGGSRCVVGGVFVSFLVRSMIKIFSLIDVKK